MDNGNCVNLLLYFAVKRGQTDMKLQPKKILAVIMCFVVCLSLLPTWALAEGTSEYTTSGDVVLENPGTEPSPEAEFDPETEAQTDTESGPAAENETVTKTGAETEAEEETETEPVLETESVEDPATETEVEPESSAETETETEPESENVAEGDTVLEQAEWPEPEQTVEPESESEGQTQETQLEEQPKKDIASSADAEEETAEEEKASQIEEVSEEKANEKEIITVSEEALKQDAKQTIAETIEPDLVEFDECVAFVPEAGSESEDLLQGYLDNLLEESLAEANPTWWEKHGDANAAQGGPHKAPKNPTAGFTEEQIYLFGQLSAAIETIAADGGSSKIEVTFPEPLTYSPADFGYEEFNSGNINSAVETVLSLAPIHHALLNTMPYQLYWYDKTTGISSSRNMEIYSDSMTIYSFTCLFAVAAAYSDGETETVVYNQGTESEFSRTYRSGVVAAGENIRTALLNAQSVVDSIVSADDLDKLTRYKDYICSEASYNYNAVNNNAAYGDPWQLIWVFDGDPSTNIVCEGYAKAFEYLCDLTSFGSDLIRCYIATGTMSGGTGAGGHMWNIMTMDDGKNYLVDVTNCDAGTIGAPDLLFLKGYDERIDNGYVYDCNGSRIVFAYDNDTLGFYSNEELTLSSTAYTGSGGELSAFDLLAAACAAGTNYTNGESIEIERDLTIPAGMTVRIGESVKIPAGVTLTVNGTISSGCVKIEATGALAAESGGSIELYGGNPSLTNVAGMITLSDGTALVMGLGYWTDSNIHSGIQIEDGATSAEIRVVFDLNSEENLSTMLDVMQSMEIPEKLKAYVHRKFLISFAWEPASDFTAPEDIQMWIRNNGADGAANLTVPEGVTFTVPENGDLRLCSADMTVNGSLVNNGKVELMPNIPFSSLILSEGASYRGGGEIWVHAASSEAGSCLSGFGFGLLTQEYSDDYSTLYIHHHAQSGPANENVVKATCEEEGHYDVVVLCTTCGAEISRETVTEPMLGHVWQLDETGWEWAEDFNTATARFVCSRDGAHVMRIPAVITTETDTKRVIYTASVTYEGNTGTDVRTINAAPQKNGWEQQDGTWYYYVDDIAQTGWQKINNVWYYFQSGGAMSTGWTKVGNTWYYMNGSGAMQTGWQKINNVWYYFQSGGAMATGWTKVGNTWYYMNGSGAMQTGWQKINNVWYYFQSGGAMSTGWTKVGNTWYYMNGSGAMQTGWQKINNVWYYFQSGGAMATGWQKISNVWYYFQSGGAMATGWQKISNVWYYFDSNGAMLANTSRKIGNKTYNFNSSGACTNP